MDGTLGSFGINLMLILTFTICFITNSIPLLYFLGGFFNFAIANVLNRLTQAQILVFVLFVLLAVLDELHRLGYFPGKPVAVGDVVLVPLFHREDASKSAVAAH